MVRPQFHARIGRLVELCAAAPGAEEWRVQFADGQYARAAAYPALTGPLAVGEYVWLNTTAVELGLGTGGLHFVVAPAPYGDAARPAEIGAPAERAAGHLMKLRYTPLQHAVLAVEEEASPYHAGLAGFPNLRGLPVVVAELHSAAMAAAVAARGCGARKTVYIMTDGAALSLDICRLARRLHDDGVLCGTITTGQAFGGDLEAVTVASALAAARAVFEAELVVISQGPGNAGTGTALGFSGLAQADHLHSTAALGGSPVGLLRISFADARPRHCGLSHHTATVLGQMTLTPVSAAVPELPAEWAEPLRADIEAAGLHQRHSLRIVAADDLMSSLSEYRDLLTTMGRTIDEDRVFFLSACAAARLALCSAAGRPWLREPENNP